MYCTISFCAISFSLACVCWCLHYGKRFLETLFLHRFSNSTMPFINLFWNVTYYWGFAAYIAYHVNHPLYTKPEETQTYIALAVFMVCMERNDSRPIHACTGKFLFSTSFASWAT